MSPSSVAFEGLVSDTDACSSSNIGGGDYDLHGAGIPSWGASPQVTSADANKKRNTNNFQNGAFLSQNVGRPLKKARIEVDAASMARIPSDRSLLPPEIWHRIFIFVPPEILGTLLRVNKLFKAFLDPTSTSRDVDGLSTGDIRTCIPLLQPELIWRQSRRLFRPTMPNPLHCKTEIDMWRLCCSRRCQLCGSPAEVSSQQGHSDMGHPGPGVNGISTVFAFGIKCCGPCLLKYSIKEIDILLSSTTPTSLLPALPSVCITETLHIVSASEHHKSDAVQGELTKLYWSEDVFKIKEELHSVRAMGHIAVEEWLEGLKGRGQKHMLDASRWDEWKQTGGILRPAKRLNAVSPARAAQPSQPGLHRQISTDIGMRQSTDGFATTPSVTSTQPRRERTREEAIRLKAVRRSEIERRALRLNPPLTPNVLIHIPSFQAATQITTAMDDNAWGVLEPRLTAQRAEAEMRVRELQKPRSELQTPGGLGPAQDAQGQVKEVSDKDWDDIQGPVRARLAAHADQVIRGPWGKGRIVNKENAPQFAAEVLIYIRNQFYAQVATDAATARAVGQEPISDPPEGPFTQRLTLENMKWVFDLKIRPHTEPCRKELFLCNGCDSERYYGFEGVVQHYAAKHTRALSVGNVVVHWRNEWPGKPPFDPSPQVPRTQKLHKSTKHPAGGVETENRWHRDTSFPSSVSQHAPLFPQAHQASLGPSRGDSHGLLPLYATAPGMSTYPTHMPLPLPQLPRQIPGTYIHQPDYNSYQIHPDIYDDPPTTPNTNLLQLHGQLENVAHSAREVWNLLSVVTGIPSSVKVFVTIHHMTQRFQSRYTEQPTILLFIEGLSKKKEMRQVRNINGLRCKACALRLGNAPFVDHDRSTFSLPQLASHFRARHVEIPGDHHQGWVCLDWVKDMVLLPPSLPDPKSWRGARGKRLRLLREAMPWLAPRQHEHKSSDVGSGAEHYHQSDEARAFVIEPAIRHPPNTSFHAIHSTNGTGDLRPFSQPSVSRYFANEAINRQSQRQRSLQDEADVRCAGAAYLGDDRDMHSEQSILVPQRPPPKEHGPTRTATPVRQRLLLHPVADRSNDRTRAHIYCDVVDQDGRGAALEPGMEKGNPSSRYNDAVRATRVADALQRGHDTALSPLESLKPARDFGHEPAGATSYEPYHSRSLHWEDAYHVARVASQSTIATTHPYEDNRPMREYVDGRIPYASSYPEHGFVDLTGRSVAATTYEAQEFLPTSHRSFPLRSAYTEQQGEIGRQVTGYPQAYELILVRDAQGEYTIKRPVAQDKLPQSAFY